MRHPALQLLRRARLSAVINMRQQGPSGAALLSSRDGEVSEWLKVPLSKSGVRKHRGFESHPLRHCHTINCLPLPGEVA